MKEALLHSQQLLSFGEVLWGIVLIAVTMVIHAVGMPFTLSVAARLWRRWPPGASFYTSVPVLILASWIIVLVHVVEVLVWSAFLLWHEALPPSDAFYFTLCQYVTVGSSVSLPDRWRLVGGMISMAGLLTFAWSTAVLISLAQRFEDARMRISAGDARAGAGEEPVPGTRPREADAR